MNTARCLICLHQLPSLTLLKQHYQRYHSKLEIITHLIKCNILLATPALLKYRNRNKKARSSRNVRKITLNAIASKSETFYFNNSLAIVCSKSGILLGDRKNKVDIDFVHDETSLLNGGSVDSKRNKIIFDISCDDTSSECYNNKTNIWKNTVSQVRDEKTDTETSKGNSGYYSHSPSASSEGSININTQKKRIKRKKLPTKNCDFSVNIQHSKSLNEENGEFYICHCRERQSAQTKPIGKKDLKVVTSDTESCSDTGKAAFMPIIDTKFFCKKCGNGYKTESKLIEHMQVHETFCRLCNVSFPSEHLFKEHMRLHIFKVYLCHACNAEFTFKDKLYKHFGRHIEERTLEGVLDMQEDYQVQGYNFIGSDYNTSINNILSFLGDNQNFQYYGYNFMKIICDICSQEVFVCDYERHLHNVHYSTN